MDFCFLFFLFYTDTCHKNVIVIVEKSLFYLVYSLTVEIFTFENQWQKHRNVLIVAEYQKPGVSSGKFDYC